MRYTEPPTLVLALGAAPFVSGKSEVVAVVLPSGEIVRDLLLDALDLTGLLGSAALCNDAGFGEEAEGVDAALLEAAREHGLDVASLRRTWVRVERIPFQPETRLMATLHLSPQGEALTLVKGAPEEIFARAVATGRSGLCPLDPARRTLFERRVSELARRGCQVLAVAYRPGREPLTPESLNGNLILLGLIALHAPPRMHARQEIRALAEAGVRVVLASGDHPEAALALARTAGLPNKEAVIPKEKSDADLCRAAYSSAVFARTTPRDRERLAEALRACGEEVFFAREADSFQEAEKAASWESLANTLRPPWWTVFGLCLLAIVLPAAALLLFLSLPRGWVLPVGLGLCLFFSLLLRKSHRRLTRSSPRGLRRLWTSLST